MKLLLIMNRSFFLIFMMVAILVFGVSDLSGEEMDITMDEVSEFVELLIADNDIGVLGFQQRFEIQKQPQFLRALCDYFDENDLSTNRMALGCLVALNMQKYPKADVERFAEYVYGRNRDCFEMHVYLYYAFLRYLGKKRFNSVMIQIFDKYKKYLSFYVAFPCARLPYLTELIDKLIRDDPKLLNARILDDSNDDWYNLVYIMTEEQLKRALGLAELDDKAREGVRLELLHRGDFEQLDHLRIRSYLFLYYGKVPRFFRSGFDILFDSKDDFTLNALKIGEVKKRIDVVKAENLLELPLRCVQAKYPDVTAWSADYYKEITKYLEEKPWLDSRYFWDLSVDYRKYLLDANTKEYLDLLNSHEGICPLEQVDLPVTEKTMTGMSRLINTNNGKYSPVLEPLCRAGLLPVLPEEFHAPWVMSVNSVSLTQNIVAFYMIYKDWLVWNVKTQCYEWANECPKELR